MAIMARKISVCVYSNIFVCMKQIRYRLGVTPADPRKFSTVLRALVSLFGGQEDFAERPSSKPKISKRSKKRRGVKDKENP